MKPEASRISYDSLTWTSHSKASETCERQAAGLSERVAGPAIDAIAGQIVKFLSKQVSESLKKYATSTTFLIEHTFKPGTKCIYLKLNEKNVLILQSKLFRSGGTSYGVKLRPIWFDPAPFKPEKSGSGQSPEMAIAMAVTPTYFVEHRRLVGTTLQILLTRVPEGTLAEAAAGEGFLISFSGVKGWEAWPMLAGPPTNQISTLKIEVAAAVKPPATLEFLGKQLEKSGGDLETELADALKGQAGLD